MSDPTIRDRRAIVEGVNRLMRERFMQEARATGGESDADLERYFRRNVALKREHYDNGDRNNAAPPALGRELLSFAVSEIPAIGGDGRTRTKNFLHVVRAKNDVTPERIRDVLRSLKARLAESEPPAPEPSEVKKALAISARQIPELHEDDYVKTEAFERAKRALLDPLPDGEEGSNHVLLHGTGGAGKSLTAQALLQDEEVMRRFPYRFYVRASSVELLRAALGAIASALDLPAVGKGGQGKEESAWQRLKAHRFGLPALIVLDNVGDPTDGHAQDEAGRRTQLSDVHDLCPLSSGATFLLTAQKASDWRGSLRLDFAPSRLVELDEMSQEEAETFLLGRTGIRRPTDSDCEFAKRLVDKIGGLPLAIDQVAAAVRDRENPSAELRRLAEEGAELADAKPYYEESARRLGFANSMRLVLSALDSLDAEEILRASCWLSPERIPRSALRDALALPEARFRTAWRLLVDRRLLRPEQGEEGELFALHRSRRECLREQADIDADLRPSVERLIGLTQGLIDTNLLANLSNLYAVEIGFVRSHLLEIERALKPYPEAASAVLVALQLLDGRNETRPPETDRLLAAFDLLRLPIVNSRGLGWVEKPNAASVRRLHMPASGMSDVSALAKLSSLEWLDLSFTKVSSLSALTNLRSLKHLVLWGAAVSNLSPLKALDALEYIDLSWTEISDLSPLEEMMSVRTIGLWRTSVRDLVPLARLSSLECLGLWETPVSDLSPLKELETLKSLDLRSTRITDLSPLKGLKSLTNLQFPDTEVCDLSPLEGAVVLEELDISRTAVRDFSILASLNALKRIHLTHTSVVDVSPLRGLLSLEWLILHSTAVTDLSPISKLTSLRLLGLSDTRVRDLSLLAEFGSLWHLSLDNTDVNDLSPLSGLKSLKDLYLQGTKVADITPLTGLTSLETLDIRNTRITDASALARALPNCKIITDP